MYNNTFLSHVLVTRWVSTLYKQDWRKNWYNFASMDWLHEVMDFLHEGTFSFICGRILTVFYKKSFDVQVHGLFLLLEISSAIFVYIVRHLFNAESNITTLICLIVFLFALKRFENFRDDKIKLFCLSSSIWLVRYFDVPESYLTNGALFLATTQFLRQPEQLKNYLRDVRLICAPMYVIAVAARLHFLKPDAFLSNTHMQLLGSSIIVILFSAIFLRPDNNETLRYIIPRQYLPSYSSKRLLHGILMFSGLILLTIDAPWNVFKVFGILNIFLYVLLKTSNAFW
ncbi:uncharacterized protein LOC130630571 [Hydractinia symbiolongicarpus]|uniref:uncharacterized protein LOC130630571 n=1 Tax=Hydractinia symbiolongicarpus TaxID=13093 RepID=UPI00254D9884|nr:uncharacterized protein LOC130630571 [Hydractinia symbiolongicarpus]